MDQLAIMAEFERSPIVITVNPDGETDIRVNVYAKGDIDRKALAALLRNQADVFDGDEVSEDA